MSGRRVRGGYCGLCVPFIAKLLGRTTNQTRYLLRNFGTYDNNIMTPELLKDLIWAVKTDEIIKKMDCGEKCYVLRDFILSRGLPERTGKPQV